MQIIPIIFSGFWIASSSLFLWEWDSGILSYENNSTTQISDWSPFSRPIPIKYMSKIDLVNNYQSRSLEVPRYVSPSPILSADDSVSIDPHDYDKKIYRYGKKYDPITYAWEKWKDIDFILMIQEESLWEELATWDNGSSVWYCQFNRFYSKEEFDQYLAMTAWEARVDLCYQHYQKYRHTIGNEFHGWNSRVRNLSSFTFR